MQAARTPTTGNNASNFGNTRKFLFRFDFEGQPDRTTLLFPERHRLPPSNSAASHQRSSATAVSRAATFGYHCQ